MLADTITNAEEDEIEEELAALQREEVCHKFHLIFYICSAANLYSPDCKTNSISPNCGLARTGNRKCGRRIRRGRKSFREESREKTARSGCIKFVYKLGILYWN